MTTPDMTTGAVHAPDTRGRWLVPSLTGLVSLALVLFMISNVTTAAWTDTTDNQDNSWATGTVALTDDAESALFQAENLVPGESVTNDIVVTNESSVPLDVKLYAGEVIDSNELASNLNVTVTAADDTVYAGTIAGLSADHFDWASGTDAYTLDADASQTYAFTIVLDDDAPESLAGTSAGIDFTWEGQTR